MSRRPTMQDYCGSIGHPGKRFFKVGRLEAPPFKFCVLRVFVVRIQYTWDTLFRNTNCIQTFPEE